MHELSLCEGIIKVIEDQAVAQNFTKVETVWLEIGEFAGAELDALRFGFDAVIKGTVAEDAKLEIVRTEGAAWCMPCGKTVKVNTRFDACPDCGSHQLQITGGDELRIKELEVND